MSYFTTEQINELQKKLNGARSKADNILHNWTSLELRSERAKEFARHGVARRVQILRRCLEIIFEQMPPATQEAPSRHDLLDATISIQTFIMNVFGVLDNIAWTWIEESGLCKPDGAKLRPTEVGLTPRFEYIRNSLSNETQSLLNEYRDWFDYIIDLRHALAHRIPLYVPPNCIDSEHVEEYQQLDQRKFEAILASRWDELREILSRQNELQHFKPFMRHSFSERAQTIVVHPQILSDLECIDSISTAILKDISNLTN
ncbi:MAG: hypothetical protein IE925_03805 [Rhodobacterales bacterium]|nr:hypothetical protein [Rhodobacterales bacterium]